ncbi:MAG TPA: PEP-CTERM sorting domain-containing protein [Tepidisphaeraceae bacterium]|nr:PEP-CTERM sorting domain-containing protein [Tepidisphaeraceae bacterium]
MSQVNAAWRVVGVVGALLLGVGLTQRAQASVIWLSQERYVSRITEWWPVMLGPEYGYTAGRSEDKIAAPDFGFFKDLNSTIGPNSFTARVGCYPETETSGMFLAQRTWHESKASVSFRLTEPMSYTLLMQINSNPIDHTGANPQVLQFSPVGMPQFDDNGCATGMLTPGDYTLTLQSIAGPSLILDVNFTLAAVVPEPGSLSILGLGAMGLLRRRR